MNNTSRRYITSAIFGVLALAAFVYASGSFSISPAFGGFFNPNDTTKAAPKGPRISIDEIDHDFNKIEQQSTAQTNFKITNTGTDTLAIVNAQPSCGCTAAVLGDK